MIIIYKSPHFNVALLWLEGLAKLSTTSSAIVLVGIGSTGHAHLRFNADSALFSLS